MLERTEQAARAIAARKVAQKAQAIANEAKVRAPVDTGNLRQNILAVQVDPLHWRTGVTNNAAYAIYVEFGTRHMAAQPFLRPAFEVVRAQD